MKKLVVTIALVVCAILVAFIGKNWIFRFCFSKDAVVAKVTRVQNKTLEEAEEEIAVYRTNVQNALQAYNKVKRLIETTQERKNEADAGLADSQRKLRYVKDRIEAKNPIFDVGGTPLSDQEVDVEIERYGIRINAAKDVSKAYATEIAELTKTCKKFEDWAVSGPIRLEALETKLKNTRQLFASQLERFELMKDCEFADVKKAYEEVLAVVEGTIIVDKPVEVIDFEEGAEEISEVEVRIQKIDSLLGDSSACDGSRKVATE